jgi:hypothetical protein
MVLESNGHGVRDLHHRRVLPPLATLLLLGNTITLTL